MIELGRAWVSMTGGLLDVLELGAVFERREGGAHRVRLVAAVEPDSVALLAVSQLCATRSTWCGGPLVLAGEIVFADGLADLLEHRHRLALWMQGFVVPPPAARPGRSLWRAPVAPDARRAESRAFCGPLVHLLADLFGRAP